MESTSPRLLIALEPNPKVREVAERLLPEVPWAFTSTSPPGDWSGVEAMLVGSLSGGESSIEASRTPRLKFVQRAFTGLDGFPFQRFPPSVQIAGNVGAFGPFVAEHAIALALASARDLKVGGEMVASGRLRPVSEPRSVYGSTAVVLGFGEIGKEIARRLKALGAHVYGLNRDGAAAPEAERMYSSHQLREAVAQGDFVFEVRPLTKLTAKSLGRAELEAMRPEAVLVNVGRAGTVDAEALFHHLRAHPEFRAAFDVWWGEDYAHGTLHLPFPFGSLPNVTGTPHYAGAAGGRHDIEDRALTFAFQNVARFFREGRPLHVVDRSEYEP